MEGTTKVVPEPSQDRHITKARLFGDDTSDHLRKQMAKARFLRGLRNPTGGDETRDQREGATEPASDVLAVEPVRVDRFSVLRKLGQGGMGVVYAAYDERLDRKVALKLLRGEVSKDARGRARMQREAQALARLSHPNVVQVHEVGMWRDHEYVAMEYVAGHTLQGWLEADERSWREILDVMIQAGRGLAAAHAAGLVHRDFKPANLLVGDDGRARVLDFGLARANVNCEGHASVPELLVTSERAVADEIDSTTTSPVSLSSGDDDATQRTGASVFDKLLTVTGAVLGTPAYMAPEQHLGERATERSDQFSFCVVLYEALFGERPYRAESRNEYAVRVTEGEFVMPGSTSGVPSWLRRAIARGLAPLADERWESMDALLAELTRERGRAWRRVSIAAGLLASIGVALAISDGTPQDQICRHDHDALADVWGDSQRARLETAFTATGHPGVERALARTQDGLDTYAAQLVAARHDACQQRWVDKLQTDAQLQLRMACLEQREGELRAAVDVLTDADSQVIEQSTQILAGLGDVDICGRVDLLELHTPAPKDEAASHAIAEVRADIAAAHAARRVGRQDEAQMLTASIKRRAAQLDYAPLSGEVALLEGRNALRESDYEQATEPLYEAANLAEQTHHPELAADAWLALAWMATVRGKPSRSELVMAGAKIDRLGAPPAKLGALHFARGEALRHAGDHEGALAEYDQVIALAESGFVGSEQLLATGLTVRAFTLDELGQTARARADLDRALQLELGLDDINAVHVQFNYANSELHHQRIDTAEQLFAGAIAGYERIIGPDFVMIGHGHIALGQIALKRGELERAEHEFELALEVLDESHEDHAWALDASANLALARREYPAAIEQLSAALAHNREHQPKDTSHATYLRARLGHAYAKAGEWERAIEQLDRAIFDLDGESPSIDLVRPLIDRGTARRELGQPLLARDSLERAVALTPEASERPLLAAVARARLALVFEDLGDDERATLLAREARTLLEGLPERDEVLGEIAHLLDD